MLSRSLKLPLFLIWILSCKSLVNCERKISNVDSNPLPDLKSMEKELSTMTNMIKEMNEKAEELEKEEIKEPEKEEMKELEKEEIKELEKQENKILENEEATESSDTENKESLEEEGKEMEETTKQQELEEISTHETPKESESSEASSSVSPTIATEMVIEEEKGPPDTFVVTNARGKVCLLAKFHVVFSIIYASKGGEQKAEVTVPKHGRAKGRCETTSKSPLLQISWQKYVFAMIFNKTEEDSWVVTSIELTYDTSDTLYDGSTNAGKKTARSKTLSLFETPMKKSYYCPGQEVVLLYSGNKQVVTARLKDVHLQPYGIEDGQFSPSLRCSKVVIDGPDEAPYVQDETVPLAVGCTLALITLLILLGFSFHRAYNAAKVDCNTME